jgi:hypothetical protein
MYTFVDRKEFMFRVPEKDRADFIKAEKEICKKCYKKIKCDKYVCSQILYAVERTKND